jgi:release factor glutamine methyltransferase
MRYAGLTYPRFDLIVSNPPYISEPEMADLPVDIKQYEPLQALLGGKDGLDGYRTMLC